MFIIIIIIMYIICEYCGRSSALIALPPEFWAEVDKVGFNLLVIKIYTCLELTTMK